MKRLNVDSFSVEIGPDTLTTVTFTLKKGSSCDIIDHEKDDLKEHELILDANGTKIYLERVLGDKILMDEDKIMIDGFLDTENYGRVPIWTKEEDGVLKEMI